ncbi:O-methyltransferase [Sulfobacillus harzensis]|uniref:O-methyltransferase n=1 Tax=Sulfobacillus harzensis TaxID=2729629 RepID=A0A7Y0L668_9FIRM|nr:O-methyltransferase [Sulfobacillus harzensis]NMP23758.1 O-methyltransferase [Sulfobacillus harzensis]
MTPNLQAFLTELKQFGEENDRRAATRAEKMLNITADTGLMIWMMIRAMKPERILEIGTSNGYSTIWWADALTRSTEMLVTVERNPDKAAMARTNFERAGVSDKIDLVVGDAGTVLRNGDDEAWDLIFLDAERSEYLQYWPDLLRGLTKEGLLIVDNALDKAVELQPFRDAVERTVGVKLVLVPIGNGELFIQKDAP